MQGKVFLDTNILIYSYSEDETEKQSIALNLIDEFEDRIIISNQIINEITNVLFKKFKLSADSIESALLEIDTALTIVNFDITTQIKAVRLKERYTLQYYDALVVATALENKCTILYSEDMQHNLVIEGMLTIVNPFNSN